MSTPPTTPPLASNRRWLLPAAFLLLGTIWGSSFLWIEITIEELPPATMTAQRLTIAAVAMLGFLLVSRPSRPTRGEIGHYAVLGLVNAGLPIFLISWGQLFVDSGTAAVLNSLTPIFSLVIAGFLLRTESWSGLRVFGVLVAFAGAIVLASREFAFNPGAAAVIGAAAVAAGAFSYAVGATYIRYRIQTSSRYSVAGGTLVFAALYTWVLALAVDGAPMLPTTAGAIVGVLWLGLLGSFIAYILYFFLISYLGATVSTMVTFVFPVVGVTLGVLLLDEVLDARLLLGTGLVVLGIAMVGLRYDAVVSLATRMARR
ncbi:MAG TPA: EamA family transporter [Candidatus Limnocylindria bacterium]